MGPISSGEPWPRPDLGASPGDCDIAGSAPSKRLTYHVLFASLQGVALPPLWPRHEPAQYGLKTMGQRRGVAGPIDTPWVLSGF